GTVALYLDGGSSTTGTTVQNNNNNFSNITVTGATAVNGWFNNDGTGSTPAKTITGNTFSNWTCGTGTVTALQSNFGNTITFTGNTVTNITGQGAITGMQIGTSGTYANAMNFSNNTVTGLSSTGTGGAVTGISNGAAAPALGTSTISGNTVNTLSSTSTTATVAGITSSGGGVIINGNTINTLSNAGATSGVTNGIMVTGGVNVSVFKNKIYDLQTTGAFTTTPGVNGIVVSGATSSTTYNVYNNLVGDLKAPAASSTDAIRGISVTATGANTTLNISFNTVNINASSSGANFGSSGIFHTTSATATTAALVLRNNIVNNTSTPAGTGVTVAYRRSNATLTNYNVASNNNLFYAGTPGAANLVFNDGTNSDQTLAAYKTRVTPRDAMAVTENPPFLSVSGASANFLHINTAVATQVESGAITIAGIADDYDGDTRNATTPDIGADEGNFLLADVSGPGISYTLLANTSCPTDVTLTPVTITDASGVNIAAGTRPRLYFKKSTNANTYVDNTNATDGWKYVEATGAGGSPFSFTTNYSLLFGGAPVIGDSLSYFVVAQDLAGTPNVGINSGTFAAAPAGVALTAAAFPLTGTVNGYRLVAAGLSGSVTIGAAGTYTSITGTGGLFEAINTQGLSSSLTVDIIDATVAETGAVALNAINYNGCAAGPYPVLIKPGAGVNAVLTGAVGTGSLIKLNGADFVTFDGSNNGSTSRNLTIQNTTATTTGNAVIWLASPAFGNGSNNDTIKNCIIEGNSATTTFTGVHVGGNTTIGVTTAGNERNNNNAITNNLFRKSQYGLTMFGFASASPDQNNIVNNNNFGTATAGEGFSLLAINADRQQNLVVSGNEVQNVTNATNVSSTPFGGIRLLDFKDGLCYKNNIHDLAYTNASTSKIYGIAVTSSSYTTAGNPSNARIYNNMVSRITSTGNSAVWNTTGILASAGYGDKYYYNTVNLNGQVANSGSGLVAAFANGDGNITTNCTNIDVRNNIFSLTGSNASAGGNFWAYYTTATTLTGSTLNYNNLYCNGTGSTNNIGRFNGTIYATLAAWQTATAQEANSVSIAPVFVSNSDAHLVPGSNTALDNLGTPIAGITDDIDGDTRSATTPDMGADEFSAPVCVTAVGGTAAGSVNGCVSYAGTITASGFSNGIGSTYQWVSATSPAGPWTAISGATNPASYTISPAITVTTYYKLAVACATNSSVDSSNVVTITINPNPTATTDQTGTVIVCNPLTSQINAGTDAASPAYQWKRDGVNISGETNAVLVVSTSGVYQVVVTNTLTGCKDSSAPVTFTFVNPPTPPTVTPAAPVICAGNVQLLTASGSVLNGTVNLGSGTSVTTASTTTSTLGPNPLQSFYGGAKQQMIVLASELTGLGLINGSVISALAFNLNAVEARTLQNYTVKISNTALNAFASTTFEPAGTVVRNPANFTPAAGWNTITFDNNYTWNGTSNLLIEVNYSNNDAGGTGTNTAIYSATGFASTLFYRVDNNTAAAVDAAPTASFAAYSQRNNMRFAYTSPISVYEWLPAAGLFSDAAGTVPYVAGTYTPTVYASPAVTTNYTAKSLSVTCENTTPFTVTVTSPASPNTLAGTPTPGATTQWTETHVVENGRNYVEAATCDLINRVVPSGASPVSGSIFSAVRVDSGANKMGTGELYAARFYAIEPATNPATSTARVTLYYLQSEFDNYNGKAPDSVKNLLPTGPADATGIANLRIRQFHGTPTGGYLPGNYTGTNEILDPADADVVWNATASRWEVTVPVSSFSGFWLTSIDFVVPVTLTDLYAKATGSTNTVYWTTQQERNSSRFIVERSADSRNFTAIGEVSTQAVNGNSSTPLNYRFTDVQPIEGKSYYRLQQVDRGGEKRQSPVVTVLRSKGSMEIVDVRPNPTNGQLYFNVIGGSNSNLNIVVRSLNGQEVMRTSLTQGAAFSINLGDLANGVYTLEATNRNGEKAVFKVVKQ
ncbi:MAG: hypothetical protein JNM68_07590, partial [Dinghuibacter sp.]|nr:hypothetical protein [Dinghuibacter sp.]